MPFVQHPKITVLLVGETTITFSAPSSSLHYIQGNALVERTVKTVKDLLMKSKDSYVALMVYRATPFPGVSKAVQNC